MKATHILIPMLSSFNIGRRRRYHVPSTARRKTFVLCYLLCIWPSMNPSVICEFAFCLSLFSFYFKKMNMLVSRKTQNGNGFHKLTSFSKRASKWRKFFCSSRCCVVVFNWICHTTHFPHFSSLWPFNLPRLCLHFVSPLFVDSRLFFPFPFNCVCIG